MVKKKIKKGTCVWINHIGAINLRIFEVVNYDKEKKLLTIKFNDNEIFKINRDYIRANRCVIFEKANGEIIIQNPDKIGLMDLKKQGIKTLRFNLQNSALQESKAANYRWAPQRDMVDKLGPIFKLLFICIAVGVIGWAAFKYGGLVLELITRSRLLECADLIPKGPNPMVTNITNPLGT